ncbi:aminotransferase class I/II-fold pyridoxal phosphate-dependent enzyme [Acidisoma cladoniae]|uniref:aminotransferase class I/II-fold pyridoxal phosphate-dependent enzyme n=1 Tax=Acidisoma cladoniae TaxID=3040935 RepID=UPI002549E70D|nr:aminotransferase class I/II-fold pyridoxal phosphate-dependent enzyme [Acidisoma sp. PAMC 29798]
MNLVDYADRRFRFAGREVLGQVKHFMGSVDQLPQHDGHRPVSFGNYDYLGLSTDSRIRAAASEAALTQGVGVSASRLIGGERDFHAALEAELADFIGTEGTLCLVSGYLTNLTVIGHLLGARDLLLIDELSHNSIVAGSVGSRATTHIFKHNDLNDLERILTEARPQYGRCLIVVEGLYSMDGDIPDLPRLLEIKQRHDAWLLVDEAHSIGVLGATGRGLCEHWAVNPYEIDLIIGTLSKAFGACGGFVAAAKPVLDWLHYTLPGFVFSVGMSPPLAAGVRTAIDIVRIEPWRVEALHDNSRHFVMTAREFGLDLGPATGHGVVPVFFRDNMETVASANALLADGFYCPPIVQVGVPRDQPRLRFFLSTQHSHAEIDQALEIVAGTISGIRTAHEPVLTAIAVGD